MNVKSKSSPTSTLISSTLQLQISIVFTIALIAMNNVMTMPSSSPQPQALLLSSTLFHQFQQFQGDQHQTIYGSIDALIGRSASLPCNITSDSPQSNHDSIKLILWYKGNEITGSPIYSIDSRNIQSNQIGLSKGTSTSSSSSKAHHFVNETIEFRAKFSESSESTGRLTINPVLESDHGMYLCRVDFKWSRTIISIVQLNVIVPPYKLLIEKINSKSGIETIKENSTLIINEGDELKLICKSIGGKPPPRTQWMVNSNLVDDSFEIINNTSSLASSSSSFSIKNIFDKIVINKLILQANRTEMNSLNQLKCISNNNNMTNDIQTWIWIRINFKPLTIKIISLNSTTELWSGHQYSFDCITTGSLPSAHIHWFINGINLTHLSESNHQTHLTKSTLTLHLNSSDNNCELTCQAINWMFPNGTAVIRDQILLNINYDPILSLQLNGNQNISEGQDVELICSINSNPLPNEIVWKLNGNTIYEQVNKGFILQDDERSNKTHKNSILIIKNANRLNHNGNYQCTASSNGKRIINTSSNIIHINVQYLPKCKSSLTMTIEADEGDEIEIFCPIQNDDNDNKEDQIQIQNNLSFKWIINNDNKSLINGQSMVNQKLSLQFNNQIKMISCQATNQFGQQKQPCLFRVKNHRIKKSNETVNGMSTAKRCQFYYESHQFNKKCTKINSDSKHNSSSSRQRTTEFIISLSNGANLIIILIFGALIMVIVMIITAKIIVKCKRRKVHYNNKIHDKNKVQNINSQEKLIQLNLNNHKPDRLFDDLLLMEKANESLYLNLMNFNELSNKSTDKSSSIMSNTTIETIATIESNMNQLQGIQSTAV